jgi:hypothetical protein
LNQDGQSNPRQLVGERDYQNIAMEAPRRSREPRSEAMLRPARRVEQDGAGALYEERAQIAISALRDAAKDAITRNVSTILRQPSVEFKLGCLAFSAVD